MVADTEWAIEHTNQALAAEKQKASDITKVVDASKSAATIATLELETNRLRNAVPRLQQKLQQAEASEYAAKWDRAFKQVATERDALARELTAVYGDMVHNLIDLFDRIEAFDRDKVDRINSCAPAGVSRRMLGVELAARNLTSFSAAQPRLIDNLRLPHPAETSTIIFPRPADNSIGLMMAEAAAAMAQRLPAGRYSSDWAGVVKMEKAQAAAKSDEIEVALKQAEARKGAEYEQALLEADRKRRTGG